MDEIRDHLKERGQDAKNHGTIELEQYAGMTMPQTDCEFVEMLNDIIMCEYDDCNDNNTEVFRDGIFCSIDITKALFRTAVILLAGPDVPKQLKPGVRVGFPSDKGINTVQISKSGTKRNLIFLNAQRIFGILPPKPNQ